MGLPEPILSSLDYIRNAMIGMVLFILGTQIAGIKFKKLRMTAFAATAVKLLIIPALALPLLLLFNVDGVVAQAILITTAMPASVNSSVIPAVQQGSGICCRNRHDEYTAECGDCAARYIYSTKYVLKQKKRQRYDISSIFDAFILIHIKKILSWIFANTFNRNIFSVLSNEFINCISQKSWDQFKQNERF